MAVKRGVARVQLKQSSCSAENVHSNISLFYFFAITWVELWQTVGLVSLNAPPLNTQLLQNEFQADRRLDIREWV